MKIKINLPAEVEIDNETFENAIDKSIMSNPDFALVVRCKDCKHFDGIWFCKICGVPSRKPDDFCSYGERKDNV